MPYGVPKSAGGDNLENTAKMESCVKQVMSKQGVDRTSAIRICKSQMFKPKKRKRR